ncbi:MAG TPA: glutathione transferase GstA [Rhizomicrobium sp.]|jgi:glutathione S-transferase|nr:glutathione transferase GstA [Rhizomicrobium sp.]
MKLYYSPGACSLSPHIVAEEAGIALEYEKVDLKTHKTASGADFYAINPKGYVPALALDDGSLLSEGPAIVQYLADLKPEADLIPRNGDVARYRVLEWLAYINSEMHKTFTPLFGPSSEEVKADAREKLAKRFAFVDAALAGKDYLTGAQFTVADAYLFVMTSWAIFQKIAVPDNVAAFRKRVTARPAVHAAMKAEGLVS